MAVVNFRKDGIIPDRRMLWDAFLIGIATTVVIFLVNFFSVDFFLNVLPEGLRMLAYVMVGVYLKGLLDFRA